MRSLPKVIFQHFRDPQNHRLLGRADCVGKVEGGHEESWIVLRVREGETGIESGYEMIGDRSAVAGLSLLTTWMAGRSWEELEAATVDGIAAELGIDDEYLYMFLRPFDALLAALADRRGEPDPFAADGTIVCTCLNVRQGRLERVIRARKLKTVAEVRHWTRACTGCRSCRDDVERTLRDCWR